MASGWSLRWKKKLRIKQIKFLFIAHCCPFTSIYPLVIAMEKKKKNILNVGKKYTRHATPIIESEKKAQELVMRQYFIFHLILGMVFFPLCYATVCFLYPSIRGFYFISSFFLILLQRYQLKKELLVKMSFILFLFFSTNFLHFFSRVQNYCLYSSKKADADVAAKLLLKVNICFKEHPLERWIRDRV